MEDNEKVAKLESMLAIAKDLSGTGDPILESQIPVLVAQLKNILEILDPENFIEHIVEYE